MTAFDVHSTSDEVVEALSQHIAGKNIIITGVTLGGLGGECARVLAKHAGLIVLAGRNMEKLQDTIASVKAETPSANLRPLRLELDSLQAVRKAAEEVNTYPEDIHVLVNNAGIMAVPYSKTVDGFEAHMGTNHFGHFLFTALIFGKVAAAGTADDPARIVNVSALGHHRSGVRFDDIDFSDGEAYDKWAAYGQSKTANILFANEIARRCHEMQIPVVAYSLHPGGVVTGLYQHTLQSDWQGMGYMGEKGEWTVPLKSLQTCAATQLIAAFDPNLLATPGAYLNDGAIDEAARNPHAASQENGERLWEMSEIAVKHKFAI